LGVLVVIVREAVRARGVVATVAAAAALAGAGAVGLVTAVLFAPAAVAAAGAVTAASELALVVTVRRSARLFEPAAEPAPATYGLSVAPVAAAVGAAVVRLAVIGPLDQVAVVTGT